MTPMTAMTTNCRAFLNGCDSWYVSLLLPIIVGLTNLSIYRPGRGEPVDGTLVDAGGAASALKVNTEGAIPARIE
jgi:hypothetical protein